MKKRLFLLPLIGAFTLAGCSFEDLMFWKKKEDSSKKTPSGDVVPGGDDTPQSHGGGEVTDSKIVMDFTDVYWDETQDLFPFVQDNTTVSSFEWNGTTITSAGCFDAKYQDVHYLSMKNKWVDAQVTETDSFAFIGNGASYGKPIKSIDVEVSAKTGAVDFVVDFGSTAFNTFSTTGVKKQSVASSTATTFSATCSDNSEFWSISATKPVGQYRKNGALAKITIHF